MALLRLTALATLALLGLYVYRHELVHPFWDLSVYASAVQACRSGQSAYALGDGFLFVYPPVSLRLACMASVPVLTAALSALYATAMAWLIWALRPLGGRSTAEGLAAFMVVGFAGYAALLSGNLTVFAHLAVLACILSVLTRSQNEAKALTLHSALLGVLLLIIGTIKPYFLAYALVPWCWHRTRPALRFAVLIPALSASILALDYAWDPAMFDAFLTALKAQTVERGDMGLSIASVMAWQGHATWGVVLHLTVWLGLVALRLFVERRQGAQNATDRLLFLLTASIMLNPRIKEYDFAPMMMLTAVALVRSLPPRVYVLVQVALLGVANMSWLIGTLEKVAARLGLISVAATPAPYVYLTWAAYLAFTLLALAPLAMGRKVGGTTAEHIEAKPPWNQAA